MKRTGFLRINAHKARLDVEALRRCPQCKTKFAPVKETQKVCTPECAEQFATATREKAERIEAKRISVQTKERKEAIKPRAQWLKEAQTAFNAYIRARDHELPCVSCGRHHQGQYHAGHYLSTGARPELRFDELNCHKQCAPCNSHLHGNLLLYRAELINRIGITGVVKLEGPHDAKKYNIPQLREIRDEYRAKVREMMK